MHCIHCGKKVKEEALFCSHCGEKVHDYNKKSEKKVGVKKSEQRDNTASEAKDIYLKSEKNRKKGILWLTIPIGLLVATLFLWAIIQFVATNASSSSETAIQIINVVLGLVGIVAVIGIIIGIPLGLVYLSKKELKPGAKYDKRSGKGDQSEIPEEIKKWSWGAAGLGWIWGAYHHVWISFLSFVPILNYVWWIVLGVKGNEWAWRNNKWASVDEFLQKQKKWNHWGLGIFIFVIVLIIFGAMLDEY